MRKVWLEDAESRRITIAINGSHQSIVTLWRRKSKSSMGDRFPGRINVGKEPPTEREKLHRPSHFVKNTLKNGEPSTCLSTPPKILRTLSSVLTSFIKQQSQSGSFKVLGDFPY